MLCKLCMKYLKYIMRKHMPKHELIITGDYHTYRKRNFEREKSVKETLSKIK